MVQTEMGMNVISLVRYPPDPSTPVIMTVMKNRPGKSFMNALYGKIGEPLPGFVFSGTIKDVDKTWSKVYLNHEVLQWIKDLRAPEMWRNLYEEKWLVTMEVSEELHMLIVLRWA